MHPNLILVNGNIHTMDKRMPTAEAVAIAGARIAAVGSTADIRARYGSTGREIDLGGRLVLPGLIDAHIHFMSYGLSLREIDLMGVMSLETSLERVRERAQREPAGQWLGGRGWDQSLWESNAFPNKSDLDGVTAEHPVFLRRKCGHAGWANSRALALAGITRDTPDPDGGEIERDESGEPTGILLERAMELIGNLQQEPTETEAIEAVELATETVHKMGIVGVHNMEGAPAVRAFQQLREGGNLQMRLLQQIPEADMDAAIQLGIRSGYGDEWIRFGAVKIFSDGALGARTALMVDPYEDEPDNVGIAVATAEHLNRQVRRSAEAGLAVHIHAIGDQANRNVLDAVEAARRDGIGLNLRHRIEHAQVLHPDDIKRFTELNVIPSMQPIHCTQDMLLADQNWGARSRLAYAWSTLLSTGAVLAFGSDAPVETPDVLQGIYAAVTRRRPDGFPSAEGWYPEECVSVQEAVYAYTLGAAYAGYEESTKGSLTEGKLADLVVLSEDIFANEADAILETEVDATMIGGDWVYERER